MATLLIHPGSMPRTYWLCTIGRMNSTVRIARPLISIDRASRHWVSSKRSRLIQGTSPFDVPSLGHVINTDALNRLMSNSGTASLALTLSVDDLELTLAGDGTLQVYRTETVSV
ncbi:MAG: HalOD1 output domain-containing protein [Natrialbaceae archaeon]|nr:HalOD1 output domain-containing protein [Natrialbaceae archaeon]